MSIKSLFASIAHVVGIGGAAASATISTATLASVHQMGNSLAGSLAASAEQSGPIGAAIATAISASNTAAKADPTMTGNAKLTNAIASVAPVVVAEAAKVGMTGIEAEAERYAEMAIENALSIVKATLLAKLGAALLHDIGINI